MSCTFIYRIVKRKRLADAFDGQGAKLYGGRWNSVGKACIYTTGNAALAQLEMLVHLNKGALLNSYVLFELALPQNLIDILADDLLPINWQEHPSPTETAQLGDAWLSNPASGLALAVPSVLSFLPSEKNYLINPKHPSFSALIATATEYPVVFDARLK